ncbi:CBS domain-containing protein [Candidatus Uabimicrobium amorphum]|uniref:Acetoin dehydrogenase n=1 Tax=Uabimicrobium amorphum TaxID=2596890 RepID=A0A5S9F2Y7_UABAM|nr:CBS domain-containing protein [Candidatus Uabimicrobium amorphum]BBM84187.1 acetoin dehydrogenase [Candidatus Uabimicrobium amorphum]
MSNKWQVEYWMKKLPETIPPTMSTREAFNKMRSSSFRHLLVVQDGQLLGLVSDRDLRRPDLSKGEDGWNSLYTPNEDDEVRYIMATELQTIKSNEHIHKAVKLLVEYRYGALPVINDQDSPIGILSVYDLLKSYDEILEKCGSNIEF